MSEDLAVIAAALAAATGEIPVAHALGAAALGIWLGDLGLYALGRWVGRAALVRAPLRWLVSAADVARSAQWFERRGTGVILLSRFAPGTRLPLYVAAGTVGAGFGRFAAVTALAVTLWTPLLGGIALWLGREVIPWVERYGAWGPWIVVALALAWIALARLCLPALTWKGRRRLIGRWRRLIHWEFWPAWVVYPPVLLWIVALALRYRSATVFTAVNPGMPSGGFIGESKSDILQKLAAAGSAVVRSRRIDASWSIDQRVTCVEEFVRSHGLEYPLVLKPDAGQRGSGVAYVRDLVAVREYVARIEVDCVVQECAHGDEFGVFYYRRPSAPRGEILSITRKVFPRVRGDGKRTLEELILGDARAVAMADHYCAVNSARLDVIPREGEEVQLVEIGNHCKGTIFLDGRELSTPALHAEIERISRSYEGFFFGRYDIRAPSAAHLQRGEGLQVIELNGATSEATHIYDPKHSVLYGWFFLCWQWTLLFEIADENRRLGVPLASVSELWSAFGRYRSGQRSHPS